MNKKQSRLRRARKARAKISELRKYRLTVHRTPRHIYAQVIAPEGGKVVTCASTLDKELRHSLQGHTGNIAAAMEVGRLVAERARQAGITSVAFDRSGFKYHGRVKALAEKARETGLEF